ncbi:hypothetical protein A5320_12825 [Rheinheimera sp. SA_1]|jgi:hypothetical protein|uniref:sugar-transfer associated ATP-grasp domain-containing protein n=1 Tax=Rheinheimera sp. SA_1 TaxID=1827365 RepID=UPI0007FC880C|nr:sugar-transfer associated ATP-grasp domain-containing protein [Rheinheimera sp. SA_1]OBP14623.1 hypothetical protein A5320_12825 [Rheinheimera sp. SA_1]
MQVLTDVKNAWKFLQENSQRFPSLPRWRQLLEMMLLFFIRNIGPGYYLQARWWRPEIPFKDKWLHTNKKEYNNFIDRWNSRPYQKTSQHKVVEKAVLQLLAVPTPEFIGFLHCRAGVQKSGQPLCTLEDFILLCQQLVGHRICLKPVEGYGGAGFAAFNIEFHDRLLFTHPFSKAITEISDWWQLAAQNPDGYIVEHYLQQHPVLSDINPHSVNTLRIWLYQARGEVKIGGAFLRVGRKGSLVDNTSSGGMICPVDITSGILQYAANAKNPLLQSSCHPDTGGQISGIQLPFWPECLALAGRALQAFPHVNVAGVDVAIAVDGPKMIELNVKPDQIGCARIDLPLKKVDQWLRGHDTTR